MPLRQQDCDRQQVGDVEGATPARRCRPLPNRNRAESDAPVVRGAFAVSKASVPDRRHPLPHRRGSRWRDAPRRARQQASGRVIEIGDRVPQPVPGEQARLAACTPLVPAW